MRHIHLLLFLRLDLCSSQMHNLDKAAMQKKQPILHTLRQCLDNPSISLWFLNVEYLCVFVYA